MKKFCLAIPILLFLTTLNFAQQKNAEWQIYGGNSDEFFAEFPAAVKSSGISNGKGGKKDLGTLYKAYFNKTFYFVVACQNTDCPQFEVVQKLKFQARNTDNSQFTEKTLNGSVIESSFFDSEGFFQKVRQLKTDHHYFILHTLSETPENAERERFLESFQTGSIDKTAKKAKKERYDELLVTDPLDLTPPAGAKIFKPSDGSTSSKTESAVNKAVSIFTKPRADYTFAARIYEISGEVLLRVTFSAKTEITGITPLRKLPFGLTEQAIAAVKEITFKPATRNETPISVTKPVIYRFTIY